MKVKLATKRIRDKETDNKTPTFYFTYTLNCKHKKCLKETIRFIHNL